VFRIFLLLLGNYIFWCLSIRRSFFAHCFWNRNSLLLLSNYIFRYLVVRSFFFLLVGAGGYYDPCLHWYAYFSSTAISHCLGPLWRCYVLLMSWQTCYCFINNRGWLLKMLPITWRRNMWLLIFFYNPVNIFEDIFQDYCLDIRGIKGLIV